MNTGIIRLLESISKIIRSCPCRVLLSMLLEQLGDNERLILHTGKKISLKENSSTTHWPSRMKEMMTSLCQCQRPRNTITRSVRNQEPPTSEKRLSQSSPFTMLTVSKSKKYKSNRTNLRLQSRWSKFGKSINLLQVPWRCRSIGPRASRRANEKLGRIRMALDFRLPMSR